MVWTRRHLHALCTIVPLVSTLPCLDAAAQTLPGTRPWQTTASIGFGLNQPSPSSFTTKTVHSDPPNVETFTAKYHVPRSPAFDIAGGGVHRSGLGFGLAYSRASSTTSADFTLVLDHPRHHAPAVGSDSEDDLARTETATHIYVSYTLPLKGRLAITFLGGPSYVSLSQDVVSAIRGRETCDCAAGRIIAEIEDVDFEDEHASAWGYHVGVDTSVRLTPQFSIGMLARYTRATVDLDDPLNEFANDEKATTALKVGGLQVTWGARFRF
jgi:hypothetical protein